MGQTKRVLRCRGVASRGHKRSQLRRPHPQGTSRREVERSAVPLGSIANAWCRTTRARAHRIGFGQHRACALVWSVGMAGGTAGRVLATSEPAIPVRAVSSINEKDTFKWQTTRSTAAERRQLPALPNHAPAVRVSRSFAYSFKPKWTLKRVAELSHPAFGSLYRKDQELPP